MDIDGLYKIGVVCDQGTIYIHGILECDVGIGGIDQAVDFRVVSQIDGLTRRQGIDLEFQGVLGFVVQPAGTGCA